MIVSGDSKSVQELSAMLKACDIQNITIADNAAKAKRKLSNADIALIIINTPLTDEFGTNFALDAIKSNAGIIMLVRSEIAEDINLNVESEGVFVVKKPLQKSFLYQAIKIGIATNRRLMGIKNQNKKLVKKLEEIKVIDRAKCILIQNLSMTESQAHRFIEKQAMDMRINKLTVAEGILKTYET